MAELGFGEGVAPRDGRVWRAVIGDDILSLRVRVLDAESWLGRIGREALPFKDSFGGGVGGSSLLRVW